MYIDEEDARDLVVEVERQLRKRQWGQSVRVEFERGTSRFMQRFMTQDMNLRKEDMYEIDGPIDLTVFLPFMTSKVMIICVIPKRIPIPRGVCCNLVMIRIYLT